MYLDNITSCSNGTYHVLPKVFFFLLLYYFTLL